MQIGRLSIFAAPKPRSNSFAQNLIQGAFCVYAI
jgi:hypothetical protein